MTRARSFRLWVVVGTLLPAAAFAETAYTRKTVNLRAGPSRDYPLVAHIPPGAPVQVTGCVDDWTWCDVSAGEDRGWVYAGNLEYPYENHRVVVLERGPYIGLPVIGFSIGPYWDSYYLTRSWYSRRPYWVHRRPPPHSWGRPGIRPARPRPPIVRPHAPRPPRPSRPGGIRPPGPPPRPHPQPVRPRPPRPQRPPRPPRPN